MTSSLFISINCVKINGKDSIENQMSQSMVRMKPQLYNDIQVYSNALSVLPPYSRYVRIDGDFQ